LWVLFLLIGTFVLIRYLFNKVVAKIKKPINLERRKLSEASHTQKSCMGFATAGYGDLRMQAIGTPYCSLPKYKKDCNTFSQAGKSVLEFFWLICLPVDWSGRCEDSCGSTGQGRPRRSEATRRLPGTPAESEAPGAEINRPISRDNQLIKIGILDQTK
jgi:hypothetical protein